MLILIDLKFIAKTKNVPFYFKVSIVMNIFWLIYLSGFGAALFYISYEYIKWCAKNRLDYRKGFNDVNTLSQIVLDSLGSWLTVVFLYLGRDRE